MFQGEEDGWFGAARGLEALDLGAEMRCGLWLSSENMRSSALVISLYAALHYVLTLVYSRDDQIWNLLQLSIRVVIGVE